MRNKKYESWLIKPVSSACNLSCRYCFYEDVASHRQLHCYGKMGKDVVTQLIHTIFSSLEDGDELLFSFQGGEPALAGLSFYQNWVACVKQQRKQVRVRYSFQTNGTQIDEAWCRFFLENQVLVGLSLDGLEPIHDQYRKKESGEGSFLQILQAKQILERYQVAYNILCTLTNPLAQHAEQVWEMLQKENLRHVQFTPCLAPMQETIQPEWALEPEQFARFYSRLFRLWKESFCRGRYYSIKLFDDLITLLTRRQATACGMIGTCHLQYVVEADGSVFPCDFYVTDEWKMGSVLTETVEELQQSNAAKLFLERKHPLKESALCQDCPYLGMCHGGCPRMQQAMFTRDGKQCGYRLFLQEIWEELKDFLRHFVIS